MSCKGRTNRARQQLHVGCKEERKLMLLQGFWKKQSWRTIALVGVPGRRQLADLNGISEKSLMKGRDKGNLQGVALFTNLAREGAENITIPGPIGATQNSYLGKYQPLTGTVLLSRGVQPASVHLAGRYVGK